MSQKFRRGIVVCFHLLFISVPLFFTWVNEELFEFPKMLLTYGLTTVIAGLWLSRMVIEKKWLVRRTSLDWPLIIFVISQTLSTIFSIHPRTSVFGYYTRFHGGLLSTLTYFILFYALVSNITLKELKKIWLSIALGAFLVAMYAIPEHFGASPSCLLITGSLDVACWKQDVQTRVFATFGQPNWLAAYAITLLPIFAVSLALVKKSWKKIFLGATSLALLLTLVYTKSRSGMLGFGVGMATLIGGYGWMNRRQLFSQTSRSFWLAVAGTGLILVLTGTPFTPSLKSLIAPPKPMADTQTSSASTQPVNRLEAGGTDSGEIRKIVWQGAVDIWRRYPLLGSGTETFAYSYYQDRPLAHNLVSEWDFLYNKAHNELLNFLATTGAVGLGSYLLLQAGFSWLALREIMRHKGKKADKYQPLIPALLAGNTALFVSNFFGFSTVMVTILMYVIFASLVMILDPTEEADLTSKNNSSLNEFQFMALIAIGIFTFWLVTQTSRLWRADKAFAQGQQYIAAGYTEEGLQQLQTAAELRPKEALYHNKLADTYSQIVYSLSQQGEAAAAIQFETAALQESALTLSLNPRHLNFYKGQARARITLGQLDVQHMVAARQILEDGIKLAPTDAKLRYNLGLVLISQGEVELGIQTLEETIEMKPNYEQARLELGQQYEAQGKIQAATEQYQYIYDHITTANQVVNQKLNIQ